MTKNDLPVDPQSSAQRQFVLAVAQFLDSRPQPPTALIGARGEDGQITMREVPDSPLQLAPALSEGLLAAERRGRGAAAQALKLAVQDLLEMTRDLTREEVADADRQLTALELPTLTATRLRVWQTVPKVLGRGRIRTELEYYLLVEYLAGGGHGELTDGELVLLGQFVGEYEARRASGTAT